ncbi:MAG: hypothetical protein ACYTFQ_07380, partial [Planctomycetota bacterium]
RKAAYRFINMHLKNDPSPVTDSEVDLVTGTGNNRQHPIEPERLRVFPADSDIPEDELNTTIDQHFVPMAKLDQPEKEDQESWKAAILTELRRVTFRYFPERIPPAKLFEQVKPGDVKLETEPGIEVRLRRTDESDSNVKPKRVWMVVESAESRQDDLNWKPRERGPGDHEYVCTPRGVDGTAWTGPAELCRAITRAVGPYRRYGTNLGHYRGRALPARQVR